MAIAASETAARPAPPPSAQPVAIISGGSRGLGLALVERFLEGHRVATFSRSRSVELDALVTDAPPETALWRSLNHADPSATSDFIREVFSRWGRIDVLVNNAGVARDGILALVPDEDIDTVVDLNLKGTIYMTRLVSRRMLARGAGSIVNISSIVGRSGYRGLGVYSATKAALDGFTRAMARELGSRGITVNGVAPGYLRTEMSHGLDEDQLGQIVRRTPAGRLGEPEDVARAIRFLTDPANTYLTGHILVIDGGLTC